MNQSVFGKDVYAVRWKERMIPHYLDDGLTPKEEREIVLISVTNCFEKYWAGMEDEEEQGEEKKQMQEEQEKEEEKKEKEKEHRD